MDEDGNLVPVDGCYEKLCKDMEGVPPEPNVPLLRPRAIF